MAPQLGIFCLEVKSGDVIRDKEGIWTISDKYGNTYTSSNGPFSQAENTMHKIIKIIKEYFGKNSPESRLIVSYGVIFNSTLFTSEDPEIEKWRICNSLAIEEAEKNQDGLLGYIKSLSQNSIPILKKYLQILIAM
ncbi:MAG: hypothetical protein KJ770_07170 [Actinobacteria bacterium]|nr:hypothetical protein [Actinomycetota bacterium]